MQPMHVPYVTARGTERRSFQDAEERKNEKSKSEEAKKALKNLLRSGIPGIESMFAGPGQSKASKSKRSAGKLSGGQSARAGGCGEVHGKAFFFICRPAKRLSQDDRSESRKVHEGHFRQGRSDNRHSHGGSFVGSHLQRRGSTGTPKGPSSPLDYVSLDVSKLHIEYVCVHTYVCLSDLHIIFRPSLAR